MGSSTLVLYTTLLLSLGTESWPISPQEESVRCAESCLKLNPNDNITNHNATYVKHCAKLNPDGKCECDWEKIFDETGNCICKNPFHIVSENNQCICDLSKCVKPMENCKLIKEQNIDNCTCPEYECETKDNNCPNDSFKSNQTQDSSDCLCFPCSAVNCAENQNVMIIRKGTQMPGSCCDLYECKDSIDLQKNCHSIADGKIYSEGDVWTDSCTMYSCKNGFIFEDLREECKNTQPCLFNHKHFNHGQKWFEDNGCTNCLCDNGIIKCSAHFCKELSPVTIRPTPDCMHMIGCKKTCAFGYRFNQQGCRICKCREPDKKTIQDILRAVNCTLENCEVLHTPPSNCTTRTIEAHSDCTKCNDSYTHILFGILVAISLVAIGGVIISGFLCYKQRRILGKLHLNATPETHKYNYMEPLVFDANSNTEKTSDLSKH